jgi:Uma2 family endonuclease
MTPTYTPLPFQGMTTFYKLTGDQYDRMVQAGILSDEDRVELLEGWMVQKMPGNPLHDTSVWAANERLTRLVPADWAVRCQLGSKLTESRPEPDVAVARGPGRQYFTRHPDQADLGLVVEVSDSSLARDQGDKARIYARDRVPVYWIVNLIDRRVEVYTDPTGPGDDPRYHTLRVFPAGAAVPVELDGQTVGTIPVDELLP